MAVEITLPKSAEGTPLKTVVVVLGALACGWAAIELALKPLFAKAGASKDKSDPSPAVVETEAKELPTEVAEAVADAGASASDAVAEAVAEVEAEAAS